MAAFGRDAFQFIQFLSERYKRAMTSEPADRCSDFDELACNEDDDEASSDDDDGASCSDAEPESQDLEDDVFSEPESDEDDDTNDRIRTISGRTWRHVARQNITERTRSVSRTGALTERSRNVASVENCFRLFVSDDIVDIIVACTNRKAEEARDEESQKKWKPVDRVEMDAFLGLLLISGRFGESRESKDSLWSRNSAFSRQVYAAVMSCDRFRDILKYIRFDDSSTRAERKANDKLAPLRDVTNIFAANCREAYEATDAGTVDEQLVTFRGRCPFKVYTDKSGRYGMKLWTLCDARTFYCCNFDVYLGKTGHQGQNTVKELTDFWRHSGRTVTTDNFFTDFALAEDLLRNEIFLVGTLRRDRKDLPRSMVNARSRQRFSSDFLFTTNLTLVSYVPRPRKCVVLLSSFHREQTIAGPEDDYKPDIMSYYDSTKNGVDTFDKLLREYSCRRSTRRWPLALFLNYVDIAAYNAFVVWLTKNPAWQSRVSMKRRRRMFLEQLGSELYARNIERRATDFENRNLVLPKHVANAIESTGRKLKRKEITLEYRKRSRCYICVGNDNKYSTRCDACLQFICNAHSMIEKNAVCVHCTLLE